MKTIFTTTTLLTALAAGPLASTALAQPAGPYERYGGYTYYGGRSGGSGESAQPTVITFSPEALDSVEMMEEDLAVMTRIFEKALEGGLGDPETLVKAGIQLLLTSGSRSVRAMYVEGVGPLFIVKVNFPLLAPPKVDAEQPEPKASSAWEQARRELKGIADEPVYGERATAVSDYSEEKVAALKQVLLLALKEATNVRQLDAGEFIAVSVFGAESVGMTYEGRYGRGARGFGTGFGGFGSGFGRNAGRAGGGYGGQGVGDPQAAGTQSRARSEYGEQDVAKDSATESAPQQRLYTTGHLPMLPGSVTTTYPPAPMIDAGRGSVLTVRVKKADLDAFADGELTFDDFAKRVSIHAYAGAGHDFAGGN